MKAETVGIILAHLIITLGVYLLFAFIIWDFDASRWDSVQRTIAAGVAIYANLTAWRKDQS